MSSEVIGEGWRTHYPGSARRQIVSCNGSKAAAVVGKAIRVHGNDSISNCVSYSERDGPKSYAASVFQLEIHPPAASTGFLTNVKGLKIGRWRGGGWRRVHRQGPGIACQSSILAPQPAETVSLTWIADIPVIPCRITANHLSDLANQQRPHPLIHPPGSYAAVRSHRNTDLWCDRCGGKDRGRCQGFCGRECR